MYPLSKKKKNWQHVAHILLVFTVREKWEEENSIDYQGNKVYVWGTRNNHYEIAGLGGLMICTN